jgi:FAD-linked oxidoreductase
VTRWRNWGRSVQSNPALRVRATSVEHVIAAVRLARDRGLTLKTVGAGHSFSAIAATDGIQLDVSALDGVLRADGALITLGAGTNLHQLPALLDPLGLAMENLGDIEMQTLAGATATGTHGTGLRFGGLATRIRAATMVTAAGAVEVIDDPVRLQAVSLGLGALGVLVDLTIECVPTFPVHALERPEHVDAVLAEWPHRIASADHFEFYVWPHTDTVLTKTNTRLPADAVREPVSAFGAWMDDRMNNQVFAATLALGRLAPPLIPPINRLAVKLTGDRQFSDWSQSVFTSLRTTRFREQEFAIPVQAVPDAVRAMRELIDARGWRISFPIEVRAAAADDLMLSTASGRDTGYIAVHRSVHDDPAVYFREVEQVLVDFGGRPHWGKMHTRDLGHLSSVYPRFGEFLAVRDELDPDRLFANPYLERVLGP